MTENTNEFVELLYHIYYEKLRSYCFVLIKGNSQYTADIDDCILEVFYTAYLKQEQLCKHEFIEGWLKQACYYRIISLTRKAKQKKTMKTCGIATISPDSLLFAYDPLGQYLENQEGRDKLSCLLKKFPDKDVSLIYEYWHNQTSIAEIAKQRNTTIGTIKNRLNRIRKKALLMREYS